MLRIGYAAYIRRTVSRPRRSLGVREPLVSRRSGVPVRHWSFGLSPALTRLLARPGLFSISAPRSSLTCFCRTLNGDGRPPRTVRGLLSDGLGAFQHGSMMHVSGAVEEDVESVRYAPRAPVPRRWNVRRAAPIRPQRPSSFPTSRSVATTRHPSRAKASAVARPIPAPAAVINAFFSFRRPSVGISSPYQLRVKAKYESSCFQQNENFRFGADARSP